MEITMSDEYAQQWAMVTLVEFCRWAEQQQEAGRLFAHLRLVNEIFERLRSGRPVTAGMCICARGAAEQLRDVAVFHGFADMAALLGEVAAFFRDCLGSVQSEVG